MMNQMWVGVYLKSSLKPIGIGKKKRNVQGVMDLEKAYGSNMVDPENI